MAGKQEKPGTHHDFNNPYLVNVLIAHGHRPCRWMVTLHRPSNVDSAAMMAHIGGALKEIAAELPLIFPLHPRTRGNLEKFGVDLGRAYSLARHCREGGNPRA